MELSSPVGSIPFVGPSFVQKLKKVQVETVKDLLYHIPHRYENFSLTTDISSTQAGEKVTIKGQIVDIKNIYTRYGKKIQQAIVSDGEGQVSVTWFNQTYLPKSLPPGTWVSLSGKLQIVGKRRKLTAPQYEKLSGAVWAPDGGDTIHTGRLVPVYPETSGLSSKWIRTRIASIIPQVVNQLEDYLPDQIKKKNDLVEIKEAIQKVHFPKNYEEAQIARRRLAFDEFFSLQLNALFRRETWKTQKLAHILTINQDLVLSFTNSLPFLPTQAQNKAIKEVLEDLEKNQAMNRLLEGDVGSGKTVIAAFVCFVAFQNGFQAAVMAPTQILASQHFKTLDYLLNPHGVKVDLVTSSTKNKGKNTANVIVGTHALIQKSINFENLAAVVIDEQHRFGVAQRALIAQKGEDKTPHILTMTATPIPRTVALTMYGDLDLSVLDEMPKGRLKIKTWVVPPQKRTGAYKWIRERVKNTKEQAFIVCPIIEESEKETMKSVKAASVEYERLAKEVFPDLKLGLLHGRLKNNEKEEVMKSFKDGDLDILVATPVVEVGIDIPQATIMMIEASERFGLAQLHQLRGRVGRGSSQSYCLLMTDSKAPRVLNRLKALEREFSGSKLAQIDLEMRGPGEVYGTAQSGFPELKVGNYADIELIKAAREAAEAILPVVNKYERVQKMLEEKSEIAPN